MNKIRLTAVFFILSCVCLNFIHAEDDVQIPDWQKKQLKNKAEMKAMIEKVTIVLNTLVHDTHLYMYKSKEGPHITKLNTLKEIEKIASRLALSHYIKQGAVPTFTQKTYIPDLQCTNTTHHYDQAYWTLKKDLYRMEPYGNRPALETLTLRHPNLVLKYVVRNKTHHSLMPDLTSIDWLNVHWQQLVLADQTEKFFLYSAFYDNRTLAVPAGGLVRVVANFAGWYVVDFNQLPWCYLWYDDNGPPVTSRVIRADYIDHQDVTADHMETYLLSCRAPDRGEGRPSEPPIAVSLVLEPCQNATNLLKVHGKSSHELAPHMRPDYQPDYDDPSDPMWRTAVCATAIFYLTEDFSLRLVEWLELMRAQGVSQVFFYHTGHIHPNMDLVMNHYEKEGFITITDFHYPPGYLDEPLLRKAWTKVLRKHMFAQENVYFTDCVLRNMANYRFIMHLDPDEMVIMEDQEEQSIPQLVASLAYQSKDEKYPRFNWAMRWRFFPNEEPALADPLPTCFHVLRHPYRLVRDTVRQHYNVKSVYDTRSATGVTSHTVRFCASGPCNKIYKVPMEVATVGHWRDECDQVCGNATELVPQVNKHRPLVVGRVDAVLHLLGLTPSDR